MKYIEAPNIYHGSKKSLFLAGGITGCPNWQADIVKMLEKTSLVLLNPRREDFPIHDPTTTASQIRWEYDHLRTASAIIFWFPCETLCPITLYELGAWSMTDKPIIVGIHPKYQRRRDIEIQIAFARPDIMIVYSLQELAGQVILSQKD